MVLEKIIETLASQFEVDASTLGPDTDIIEDLGADSLDVVELLSRLEDEYGVMIPDEEVENLVTVADVAAEIEKLIK